PHEDPTPIRFWEQEQGRPGLGEQILTQLKLIATRDGVVEQYSTWFPGMTDIFLFGIDSIPTPPALESPEEEAEAEMLYQQAQNLLEVFKRRKAWEALQASHAKVTNTLVKTGPGQARSGQTRTHNIVKGLVNLSNSSDSEWSDGPKKAKKKDKIGTFKPGSTLQLSGTLNGSTTMNTRSMGTGASGKPSTRSQTSGTASGGTPMTRSMTMTRVQKTGSALQGSGTLHSGIKKKGTSTSHKAGLAKNMYNPVKLIELSDSSDETKKSESTGKPGTGKKRVGKTESTHQDPGALSSGTRTRSMAMTMAHEAGSALRDPGALHRGSRTRSMISVESCKAGSCLQNSGTLSGSTRTRSMAMTMAHKAGTELQNSGTLSGGVKENQSISKSIACNAEPAMYEQDPIELSNESDGSTGRDSTKSTKGKCKILTRKAGLAPQDPGNLHGTTTFTLTNIIKSLDVTAASKKFETISCQPATTKARTPTATQTSIHLKNLGDFDDSFLCTSNSQYSEPEPCSPVQTAQTAPTQYGAMSKVIPLSTLKICTELAHQAILPVVETMPPSSSKSNRLKQEELKNVCVSVSNYFLWIPI
ncbi:hypothetical protein BGZ59_002898, partial [Podila verticillata]